jgi:hypothetical protein
VKPSVIDIFGILIYFLSKKYALKNYFYFLETRSTTACCREKSIWRFFFVNERYV